jgi:hypothetical protein
MDKGDSCGRKVVNLMTTATLTGGRGEYRALGEIIVREFSLRTWFRTGPKFPQPIWVRMTNALASAA